MRIQKKLSSVYGPKKSRKKKKAAPSLASSITSVDVDVLQVDGSIVSLSHSDVGSHRHTHLLNDTFCEGARAKITFHGGFSLC